MGKYSFMVTDDSKTIRTRVTVDLSRVEGNLSKAQYKLDNAVMTSMEPFMAHQSGTFINTTKAMSAAIAGTGKVVAAAPPMGRFLYEGKTMVDEVTGSPWARAGAKKVLVSQYAGKTNAKPYLTYSHGRTSHWFEKAKEKDLHEWVKIAQEAAGGK